MQVLNISRKEKNLCEVSANETQTEKQLTNKHPGKKLDNGSSKKKGERTYAGQKNRSESSYRGSTMLY